MKHPDLNKTPRCSDGGVAGISGATTHPSTSCLCVLSHTSVFFSSLHQLTVTETDGAGQARGIEGGFIGDGGFTDGWMNGGAEHVYTDKSLFSIVRVSHSAIYLCKRTMQNKTRLDLADYEAVSAGL